MKKLRMLRTRHRHSKDADPASAAFRARVHSEGDDSELRYRNALLRASLMNGASMAMGEIPDDWTELV